MQAREAVEVAKKHVAELFEAEPIREIGLEEVELRSGIWSVTIGFTRDWPVSKGIIKSLGGAGRTYKAVSIDDETGSVQSLRHREVSRDGSNGQ